MSVPCRNIFIVDAMAFRRARTASFLAAWAHSEQAELASLDPDEAHARLIERGACDMLICTANADSAPDMFAEVQVLRMLGRNAAIAIVSDDESPATVIAAIRSGAQGYLGSSMPPQLALRALSFVLHGGTYFPPSAIIAGLGLGSLPAIQPALADLTPVQTLPELAPRHLAHAIDDADRMRSVAGFTERQYAVLGCLCRGDPNKVIGRKLGMTETTVKVHVREIMRKLGVCNRTQVAIAAGRGGFVADGVGLVPQETAVGWISEA
jgi:DNA-binding NarL/FixJ family response regulator